MESRSPPVAVASSAASEPQAVANDLAAALGEPPLSLILFFAGVNHPLAPLSSALRARFPGVTVVGCTSAGEYGPGGYRTGTVSAMGLRPPIRAAAELVPLESFTFDAGAQVLDRLAAQIGTVRDALSPARHVLLALTDGLSGLGELVGASIGAHALRIPLVGGCASDDLSFQRTEVIVGDRVHARGGVVVLLEPNLPFVPFACHHFHPTEQRVVVTRAEPKRRLIQELDGWPAHERLAGLLDVPVAQLLADPVGALAKRPAILGLWQGGDWYVRSVMTVEPDGLLMGGAVEEGTVFRWMRPGDLVEETRSALDAVASTLNGAPAATLLFHCSGRMRAASASGLRDSLTQVMGRWPTAGFDTFGEHFGPFLVNETLTGLALGTAP